MVRIWMAGWAARKDMRSKTVFSSRRKRAAEISTPKSNTPISSSGLISNSNRGGNNGVGIRCERGKDAAYHGMEIQILDDSAPQYAKLKPYQYHGSIYGVVAAKRGHLKPAGEWNTEEITANGSHITVKLNGTVIVDADIEKAGKPKTIDGRTTRACSTRRDTSAFWVTGTNSSSATCSSRNWTDCRRP